MEVSHMSQRTSSQLSKTPDRTTTKEPGRDSKASSSPARSHQEYIDSLIPPTHDESTRISALQEVKEEVIIARRLSMEHPELSNEERRRAAGLIQKNYRGYRERRQMRGLELDPSRRWVEAVKEARYRNLTTPKPRVSHDGSGEETGIERSASNGADPRKPSMAARRKWKKVGQIAKRAVCDEDSDATSDEDGEALTAEEREERRRKRSEEKAKRTKDAKLMDLQYWLEMCDLKHRYGSNLRTYHQEWKKAETHENFFYWLDKGEGRLIDCQGCPRERLDREQVRYLSREERKDYLVKIDQVGRLCWVKNGHRIDTTTRFKDSIHGIVPVDDIESPSYTQAAEEAAGEIQDFDSSASETSSETEHSYYDSPEAARADKYATPELDDAKGVKKVNHVSAATIFNKLLRGSVKKNTWIFVADTSFRLYVGIKQSGAFQHSSFLHGSRISAAGLVKIKDGRLDKLSPLSGHYRPPVSSFRSFVHSLKDAGADMSHVSISRSYAVLVGLEAYVKTRRRGKRLVKALIHGRDKIISPDELREREEKERDKSESAAREKHFLEQQEALKDESSSNLRLMQKLHMRPISPWHEGVALEKTVGKKGDAESAIPPEGTRRD